MKKLFLFIAIVCVAHFAKAQDSTKQLKREDDRIFTFVEQKPEFVGGEKALMKFLAENIKYPKDARKQKVEGKVFASFVVEKDGTISNITLLKRIFPSCDEEVVRVLNSMPKWIAGKRDGQNVKVRYTLPVEFSLK